MPTKNWKISGSPNLGVKGCSQPPPPKFFCENAFFSNARSKKVFSILGGSPPPQNFSSSKIHFFERRCFSLRSDVFLRENFNFCKNGGFLFFPLTISRPFVNFGPQISGLFHRAFQTCQNMWTKVHKFRESGGFRFLHPCRGFVQIVFVIFYTNFTTTITNTKTKTKIRTKLDHAATACCGQMTPARDIGVWIREISHVFVPIGTIFCHHVVGLAEFDATTRRETLKRLRSRVV